MLLTTLVLLIIGYLLPTLTTHDTYDNQGSTTLNIHTPAPTPTPALPAITAPTTHL